MSLNDFYHVVSKKIEDIYNSSNHSFQKWIKHSHPSRHQKVSYSLEKLTITTSQEVCAAVLDGEIPLLCTIYFVQLETKEHFFHIFLSRSKRIPLNRMFFFSFFLPVELLFRELPKRKYSKKEYNYILYDKWTLLIFM